VKDIRRALNTAVKKARPKTRGDGAHLLRHSAAVMIAEAGIPMQEISQYLGHSSTDVIEKIYARFSPNYLRKAAATLDLPPFSFEQVCSSSLNLDRAGTGSPACKLVGCK
jgi:integrase